MTKRNGIKMNLPAADDLFSIQEERDQEQREYLLDIPLEEISDFPDHPFKVVMKSCWKMAKVSKARGIVRRFRPKDGPGYEMVSVTGKKSKWRLGARKYPALSGNFRYENLLMLD